ncbi:unnamed protein product [Mucor circinelloides]
MKDILSPTTQHAYLDFDFSEFIDKNFDMSNGILPNTKPLLSPCNVSSSSVNTHLDDLLSDTASIATNSNYALEHSPSFVDLNNPLWSSIEELAYNTSKKEQPTAATSLSCIDTFIKDPSSDLVELVQRSQAENDLFQNLIIDSLMSHQPQYDYYHQQRMNYEAQQKYYREQHIKTKSYTIPPPPADPPRKRKQQLTTKRSSTKSNATSQYSSTNNTQYTHSDQVNAQLLKELIRQAGRNSKNPMNSNLGFDMAPSNRSLNISPPLPSAPMDLQQYTSPMMNGNYPANQSNPPLSTPATTHYHSNSSNNSSRYSNNLPYKIQTNAISKKSKQQKTHLHHHHPYQRTSSTCSSSNAMGKPSMYSSDISQAQLLEIQAISRAQQDYIRAREQQEAEKGLLMKHHHHHHSKKSAH